MMAGISMDHPHLKARNGVREMLKLVGVNPEDPGLVDTPRRVVDALLEMTAGTHVDPQTVLATVFNESCDQMVLVRGIRFVSLCEHHLLPFSGEMAVAYVPAGKLIGLSKIPRLVEVLAKRLQMQERLTMQVATELHKALAPKGVGVIARAHHACMGCRGVRQPDADMVTSHLLGCLLDQPAARAEFMALAGPAPVRR